MAYMQAPTGEVFLTEYPEHLKDCTRLTQAAGKIAARDYAREQLRGILKPGTTVYTVLRHCSASGMSRRISLQIVDGDSIRQIDHWAADAMGDKVSDKGGITVTGCGMDMGFHLVYNLGAVLWPNGTPEPHGRRNGEPDSAGGYALKHQWL